MQKGLINKQVFDVNIFTPGTPLRIKSWNHNDSQLVKGYIYNCLVIQSHSLELKLSYLTKHTNEIRTTKILIEEVHSYDIDFLAKEIKNEAVSQSL